MLFPPQKQAAVRTAEFPGAVPGLGLTLSPPKLLLCSGWTQFLPVFITCRFLTVAPPHKSARTPLEYLICQVSEEFLTKPLDLRNI